MRYNYAKDLAVSRRLTLYFDAFLGLTVRRAIVNHINESFHELLLFLHPQPWLCFSFGRKLQPLEIRPFTLISNCGLLGLINLFMSNGYASN